jgi:hypothetical protein
MDIRDLIIKCALCKKPVDTVESWQDFGPREVLKFKVTCHGETDYSEVDLFSLPAKILSIEGVAFQTLRLGDVKK